MKHDGHGQISTSLLSGCIAALAIVVLVVAIVVAIWAETSPSACRDHIPDPITGECRHAAELRVEDGRAICRCQSEEP